MTHRVLRAGLLADVCGQRASGPSNRASVAPSAKVAAPAPVKPEYTTRAEHDLDGIGKFYMGREIAKVMGHESARWLERPQRERQEHGAAMLAALKIKAGDVVADIGAGSGYYTTRLARIVGVKGRVKAVDIQQEMLDLIRKREKRMALRNIDLVLGQTDDPKLEPESVDLVLMVDVYHEFDRPFEMMQHIVKAPQAWRAGGLRRVQGRGSQHPHQAPAQDEREAGAQGDGAVPPYA